MTGRDDHATGHPFGVPDGSDMEPNEYADHQRRAERFDLRALSLQLEDEAGYDSIPTIERMYLDCDRRGVYECVYPGCSFVRRDPVKMWRHVHFGTRHGWSFGMSLQRLVAARLEVGDA